MPKSSSILIWTVCAAVFVLSICKASARDLGQWEGVDPLHREWFNGLMRPDNPTLSCCGLADAYWADSYEVKGDEYIAIITDTRDDRPLGRPHIDNGRRFAVPNSKIKWDRGNPTGHGIIFIGHGLEVHCYLPPGGIVTSALYEVVMPIYQLEDILEEFVTPKHSTAYGRLITGTQVEVGLLRYKAGEGAKQHAHPQEQILLVLSGKCRLTLDGKPTIIGSGMAALIPPNTPHALEVLEDTEVVSCKGVIGGIGHRI